MTAVVRRRLPKSHKWFQIAEPRNSDSKARKLSIVVQLLAEEGPGIINSKDEVMLKCLNNVHFSPENGAVY